MSSNMSFPLVPMNYKHGPVSLSCVDVTISTSSPPSPLRGSLCPLPAPKTGLALSETLGQTFVQPLFNSPYLQRPHHLTRQPLPGCQSSSCLKELFFSPNSLSKLFPCSVSLSLLILSSTNLKLEIAEPGKRNSDFFLYRLRQRHQTQLSTSVWAAQMAPLQTLVSSESDFWFSVETAIPSCCILWAPWDNSFQQCTPPCAYFNVPKLLWPEGNNLSRQWETMDIARFSGSGLCKI